jgi:hypothetical protein
VTSEMTLNLPAAKAQSLHLNFFPNAPKGLTCQWIAVGINDIPIAEVFLEKGWHWYRLQVPQSAIRPGVNKVNFSYAYAARRAPDGSDKIEARPLSVAFHRLEVLSGNADSNE